MKNRKVYIVMCHHHNYRTTYISEVCSSKKKADFHLSYISGLMNREEPENPRTYWILDQRIV